MPTELPALTTPASPRPARIPHSDGSTSEFVGAGHLYSVLVSYSTSSAVDSETGLREREAADSSKNEITIAARIESKRRKIVQLSEQKREHFAMLRKYEGVIISREDDSFTARLYESPSDYPVMEAEFNLADVPESEWPHVIEGAPLVWTISYRHQGSTRSRDSMIYLRRSAWTAEEVAAARDRASTLVNAIDWNESTAE